MKNEPDEPSYRLNYQSPITPETPNSIMPYLGGCALPFIGFAVAMITALSIFGLNTSLKWPLIFVGIVFIGLLVLAIYSYRRDHRPFAMGIFVSIVLNLLLMGLCFAH
jgi:hypothetical protein